MGKIQQQIKQDLNVAGALYTQTASYQQKQAEKAVQYEQKSLEKQRENIEQSSIKPEIKQRLLDENLAAQVKSSENPVSPASPEKISELRELNEARKSRIAKEKEAKSFEEERRDRDIQAQEAADYFDRQEELYQELYGDVKDDKKADMSQKVASVSEKSQNSQRSRVQNKLKNLKSTGSREPKKDIKFTRI